MKNMNRLIVIGLAVFALYVGEGQALTVDQRDQRYFSCFKFSELVLGGTVRPHWSSDGYFWWVQGGDTLGVTFEGEVVDSENLQIETEKPLHSPPSSERPGEVTEELPGPAGVTALIMDQNLWLEGADGVLEQMTQDGGEDLVWTLWGANWSADGRYLAVSNFDARQTPSIPIVDWLDPAAPMVREPSTQACEPRGRQGLFLFQVKQRTMVAAPTDEDIPEPLWVAVGWVPISNELLTIRFNRIMNRQELWALEPETGRARMVLGESSKSFIDGLSASFMMDWYYHPLGDNEHFIWLSERDGFHHLYLYRYDGTLVRRLTSGNFPVLKIQGIDRKSGWVYFWPNPTLRIPPANTSVGWTWRDKISAG